MAKKKMGDLEAALDQAFQAILDRLDNADLTALQKTSGVHRTSMYDVLKGKTSPSVRTLAKVAKGLDETPAATPG